MAVLWEKLRYGENEAIGTHTDAKGIMFSLPADETVGLGVSDRMVTEGN
jgi:hypothetical protein